MTQKRQEPVLFGTGISDVFDNGMIGINYKMCHDCLFEQRESIRDADARCLICDVNLCGGHILKHLKERHCVGTHLHPVVKQ